MMQTAELLETHCIADLYSIVWKKSCQQTAYAFPCKQEAAGAEHFANAMSNWL